MYYGEGDQVSTTITKCPEIEKMVEIMLNLPLCAWRTAQETKAKKHLKSVARKLSSPADFVLWKMWTQWVCL